jgi:hypothetical protein
VDVAYFLDELCMSFEKDEGMDTGAALKALATLMHMHDTSQQLLDQLYPFMFKERKV